VKEGSFGPSFSRWQTCNFNGSKRTRGLPFKLLKYNGIFEKEKDLVEDVAKPQEGFSFATFIGSAALLYARLEQPRRKASLP
jgi:hypothetical protein